MKQSVMTLKEVDEALHAAGEGHDLAGLLRLTSSEERDEQEAVLKDILTYGKDCEYGRKYGFGEIQDYPGFVKNVPVTEFSDYKEYIERMKLAGEDILFPGKASSFVVSTGTTGIPKYIPESKEGALAKSLVSRMRSSEWKRIIPDAELPERKYLPVVNAAVYEMTEGGIPAGSASGLSAKSRKKVTRKSIPDALLTIPGLSREAMDYLTVLFSLAEREVAKLACNNVAHFSLLWNMACDRADLIISDIRSGTMSVELKDEDRQVLQEYFKADPARADELEEIFKRNNGKFTIEEVWPHFEAVVCWIGGSVGRTVKEFRHEFPERTVFINWGYGASEGKFDVPVEAESTEGILTLFGYFYEFLKPGEQEPVPLWEAEDDVPYELVLTGYSGFYRYNIHDLVKLGHTKDGMRTITFLGKTSDSLELAGKRLYSGEFLNFIEQYEKEYKTFFRLIQGSNDDGRLRILAENAEDDWDIEAFGQWARDIFEKHGIPFAGVTKLNKGYRDSLFEKVMDSGKSVNSTKVAVFV